MYFYMLTERNAQNVRPANIPLDGRYAFEAFALFLQHVEAAGTRPSEYQAKLFGGSNMFDGGSTGKMDALARHQYGRQL